MYNYLLAVVIQLLYSLRLAGGPSVETAISSQEVPRLRASYVGPSVAFTLGANTEHQCLSRCGTTLEGLIVKTLKKVSRMLQVGIFEFPASIVGLVEKGEKRLNILARASMIDTDMPPNALSEISRYLPPSSSRTNRSTVTTEQNNNPGNRLQFISVLRYNLSTYPNAYDKPDPAPSVITFELNEKDKKFEFYWRLDIHRYK